MDILLSLIGLIIFSPILIILIILIFIQDFKTPFYSAVRVGLNGNHFKMFKLRSMKIGADSSGVESTSKDDRRITFIGKFIRASKIDELSQLWNVFIGNMSLVGPRPNTIKGVEVYNDKEKKLLSLRPGITDISSIVFSDEGDILNGSPDPDLLYNNIIRPWKSQLGLIYIEHSSLKLDLLILFATGLAIIKKDVALCLVNYILIYYKADDLLIEVCKRKTELHLFKSF